MAILTAALAFAIIMLILSMVTSVFVETIHRLVGLRERGLQLMLGHVFDRVIAPYIERAGLQPQDSKSEFLDFMTVNRAPAGALGIKAKDEATDMPVLASNERILDRNLLSRVWRGRRLAKLDADEFMSRLGSSPFGGAIEQTMMDTGHPDPDAALKDIAEKFDAFGREASVFFERRARLVSVLVSIGIAWFMYVHPYEIFSTFMSDPKAAEAVIAMQEATLQQFEERVKSAKTNLDTKIADAQTAEKQLTNAMVEEAEKKAQGLTEPEQAAFDDLGRSIKAYKTVAANLHDAGVPIGWTKDRLEAAGFKELNWGIKIPYPASSGAPRAILWLVLGGLLVGLGGPFWYDIVTSLSNIRAVLGSPPSTMKTGATDSEEAKGESEQPKTPIEHFKTGAAGRAARDAVSEDNEEPVG